MHGQFAMNNVGGFAMGLIGAGVIIGIGVYTVFTMKTSLGANDSTVNTTFDKTISGASGIASWLPVLVVAGMGFLALSFFTTRGV